MKIAILGYGREGKSVLKLIKKFPRFRGAEISILDRERAAGPPGIKTRTGKNYLKNLSDFDLVFRSPGIPYNLPQLKKARKHGVKFSSATKLFFEFAGRKTRNVIGITGTKGKGTTSTLLYNVMRAAGFKVYLAGNIGMPMLELLPKIKKNNWVILELSSFQLHDLEVSPHIAVVLDVFPDHQDAHLNLKEYYEAKTNIARHQKRSDRIFFFKDHPLSRWIAQKSRGRKISVDEKKWKLFHPDDLKIPGGHNFKNAVMAGTIARTIGAPPETIVRTVKNFRGLEHRLEFVRKLMVRQAHRKNKSAIYFYNDSSSTSPQTAAAAIKSFPGREKILIAGGHDKNLDYAPLARALKNSDTKLVVLFGENKNKIKKQLVTSNVKMEIKLCKNLQSALRFAYKKASRSITNYQLPITILFSPGAASFDQFHDYADRGRQFKTLVKKLGRS